MNVWSTSCHFIAEGLLSCTFRVTLWPWVKVKVIHAGIKMYSLSSDHIWKKSVCRHLNARQSYTYSCLNHLSSLLWSWYEPKETNWSWQHATFYPNQMRNLQETKRTSSCFIITVILNEGQVQLNCYQTIQFSSVYRHTKLERKWSANVQMQPNFKVLFAK